MLTIRKERRSFDAGDAQVVVIRTDRLRPVRLTAVAKVRAAELAHILGQRFERPVMAAALPPPSLRASSWSEGAQPRRDGHELLALRSLAAAAVGAVGAEGGDARAERFLRDLEARGLVARARHDGGPGAVLTVVVGGLGFPRALSRRSPGRLIVNSHFFVLEPAELDRPHAVIGDPVGMLAVDGVVVRPPVTRRATLVQGPTGWSVTQLGPDDVELRVGDRPGRGRLLGRGAESAAGAFEAVLNGRWPMALSEEGGLAAPHGGLVARWEAPPADDVRGILRRATPVSYLVPRLPDLIAAVQGGPELVREGEVVVSERQLQLEGLPNPMSPAATAPLAFPTDVDRTPAARVAAAVTASGELLIAVVEGASSIAGPSASGSSGCTLVELARLLRDAGAVEALNLDGGGSAQAFEGASAWVVPGDTRRTAGASFDRPVPVALSLG